MMLADTPPTARHLVEAKKVGRKNTTAVVEEPTNPIDLGWKEATPKLNKKGKQKAKTVDDDVQGSADGAATVRLIVPPHVTRAHSAAGASQPAGEGALR